VEGVIRILTTLALGVALAVTSPGIAIAEPTREPMGAQQALAPSPSPSPTPQPVVSVSPGDHRVGGTPGVPQPPTPGWAWWVGAAMIVAIGAGGVRLWRTRPAGDERWTDDEFWTQEQDSTQEQHWTDEGRWPDGDNHPYEQRWNDDTRWTERRED